MDAVISLSELTYHYGDRCAVDEVQFDVSPGEIFALVGPNGGGKTTLFRLLSTLVPVQRGSAMVMGYDLRTERQKIRQQLGVVFQAASLDKKLTVDENLLHQGHLYGLASTRLKERRDQMLERFGLVDRRNDLAETLSGGEQQMLATARALCIKPGVLLLDEPTEGLQPSMIEQIR
ncbi:MAG: ABC transporter ATP-binding protein, partial [Planctomycetales bacterium]